MKCWLAKLSDEPCEGRLQGAHLIPKQILKRKLGKDPIWDHRVWVVACERHHQRLDGARSLRIPRERLPAELESFARAHGLSGWLEREYGPLSV